MNSPVDSLTPKVKSGTNVKDDASSKAVRDALTLLSVPVDRPQDGLTDQIDRLNRHNKLVTELVFSEFRNSLKKPSARPPSYAHGGVLIFFDSQDSDQALLAAAMILKRLHQAEKPDGLAVRIGLSLGTVESKHWDDDGPEDLWGEPIEIAKRLVSDIAKPGQIILDSAACHTANLGLVRTKHPKAAIYPVSGVELNIHGAQYRRSISELTLTGDERKPQNRRQLAEELNQIQSKAMQLRFKLKEIVELTLQANDRQQRGREFTKFSEIVELLDPEELGREAKDLKDAWTSAEEARKDDGLDKANDALQSAIQELVDTWAEKRAEVLRAGEESSIAAGHCTSAADVVNTRAQTFNRRVTKALKSIEQLL